MAMGDTLDRQELQRDLGTSWGVGLILSNPELMVLAYQSQGYRNARLSKNGKKIVKGRKFKGAEWDETRTSLMIQNSEWYKSRDGSLRMAENARLSDPATWQRNVADLAGTLQRQAVQMGADLSGQNLNELAEKILTENYLYVDRSPDGQIPPSVVNSFLVPYIKQDKNGNFAGNAATNAASLRAMARDYGVTMTDKWYLDKVQRLQAGEISDADVRNELVMNAKSTWAPIADQISDTTPTAALASGYISAMAATWGIDEDTIDLNTPEIKRALTFIDPNTGKPRQKSVWEFEQELRQDPRWDVTEQGQAELSAAGMSMMRDFGFWK